MVGLVPVEFDSVVGEDGRTAARTQGSIVAQPCLRRRQDHCAFVAQGDPWSCALGSRGMNRTLHRGEPRQGARTVHPPRPGRFPFRAKDNEVRPHEGDLSPRRSRPSKAASALSTLTPSIGGAVRFEEHDDEVPPAPTARPETQRLDYGAPSRHVRPERLPMRFAAVVISGTVGVKHRRCGGYRSRPHVLSFSLTAAMVRLPERD
jgi:hypothetical protein